MLNNLYFYGLSSLALCDAEAGIPMPIIIIIKGGQYFHREQFQFVTATALRKKQHNSLTFTSTSILFDNVEQSRSNRVQEPSIHDRKQQAVVDPSEDITNELPRRR